MSDYSLKTKKMIAATCPAGIEVKQYVGMPEGDRVNLIHERSRVPNACGQNISASPARGAFEVFMPRRVAKGGTRINDGYGGAMALRELFVLEAMNAVAERDFVRKGGDRTDFEPLFDHGQVAIGRHYRDLVERHAAGGAKCSSLEAMANSGMSGGGDYTSVLVHIGEEIDLIRKRIGRHSNLVIRQVRPSKRGGARATAISDLTLVDAVCLGGMTLSAVLEANGWTRRASHIKRARAALVDALDRMQGYSGRGLEKMS